MRPRLWYATLLFVLLLACSASAEAPKLSITGPDKVLAGSAVFLQVETDTQDVKWKVVPSSAANNFIFLTLYQGQTPDGKVILKYAGFFSSPTPGTYTFIAAGNKDNQTAIADHTLVNGDVKPDPDPDPNPPPPPPGERFVLVVAESATRTAAEFQTLSGLTSYCQAQKHEWRVEDPDLKDSQTGKTPAWFQSYLDRIRQEKLAGSVLVVAATKSASDEAQILAIVPLPKTAEEAIAVVKKWGG